LKAAETAILDVRTSAHPSFVLPLRYLSTWPKHRTGIAHPAKEERERRVICLMHISLHRKPKSIQTVKLTLASSGRNPSEPTCKRSVSSKRNRNRPHVPSSSSMSKSQRNPQTKSTEVRPNLPARPA